MNSESDGRRLNQPVNPLRRLKLKSQLRNCDYVLAGTVIKQQYYDPAKSTVINGLIDEFMANPNFENALKLIEYNEMLTFYFTESCAGGLYVRKQDSASTSSISRQQTGVPDDAVPPVSEADGITEDAPLGATKVFPEWPESGTLIPGRRKFAASEDPAPGISPDERLSAEPIHDLSEEPSDEPAIDPKRKFRQQKQKEILQESEALMEQLLSLDIRRRKPSKAGGDSALGKEDSPTADAHAPEPDKAPDRVALDDDDAATRKYAIGEPVKFGDDPEDLFGGWPASSATDPAVLRDEAVQEAAAAVERDSADEPPAKSKRTDDGYRPDPMNDTGSLEAEPIAKPKPAWARKPYSVFDDEELEKAPEAGHPDNSGQDSPPATIPAELSAEERPAPDTATHVPIQSAPAQPEPPVHRLPKRSYANVIATLKIDIHTMATQLEDYRRQLSYNPSNEQQLINWIKALEDAIEEFSQVVDHLEEQQ